MWNDLAEGEKLLDIEEIGKVKVKTSKSIAETTNCCVVIKIGKCSDFFLQRGNLTLIAVV